MKYIFMCVLPCVGMCVCYFLSFPLTSFSFIKANTCQLRNAMQISLLSLFFSCLLLFFSSQKSREHCIRHLKHRPILNQAIVVRYILCAHLCFKLSLSSFLIDLCLTQTSTTSNVFIITKMHICNSLTKCLN